MESTGEDSGTDHRTFATKLSQLKHEGSALLVVGNLAPEQYQQACHHMLGDDTTATRRRVLVTTDQSESPPTTRLTQAAEQSQTDTATHIRYIASSRSASATGFSTTGLSTEYVDESDLSTLGIKISEAIDDFQQLTSGLSPAELRVCFDSLRPLLGEHDTKTVFQFLHLLTGRVRDVRGMGHFHLPVASDDESVRILAPLFDATVELRCNDASVQQRWRIPDEDVTTSWFPV